MSQKCTDFSPFYYSIVKDSNANLTVENWRSKIIHALTFYRSKMLLDCPNLFGWIQTVLAGPNYFVQVQIRLFLTNFFNLDLSKMVWTMDYVRHGKIQGREI